jgi:ATP/maltotriose-dependent transcriptional regulator MalT
MQLFNSLSQQIETFVVRNDEVKLYVCGITPYDTAHLGHALYSTIRVKDEHGGTHRKRVIEQRMLRGMIMNESTALHDQLLATKFFIPSFSHALILRPRLIELLTKKSQECKLTLVSAPAGFGKTTLLSNWIHSLPAERARVAWVSLDEGDNEPALFWQYVLTALDRALRSQQVLEQLERANLFLVSLDGQRQWYRYHALFAETLRHRLEETQSTLVPGLHSRASQWYARAGRLVEALSHAITAQEWPWAADLLERVYPRIWGNSDHARMRRWLEELPADVVRSRPRLCLASAKTVFMGASYTTIERWLDDAETALRDTYPTSANSTAEAEARLSSTKDERENLLGEMTAQRAVITGYYLGQGPATLTFCQQALAHLSEGNLLARAEMAYAQSLAYYSSGDIVAAIQRIREATALAQAAGDTSSTIIYLCRTAYSLLLHGKLHEVVQIARQATLLGATPARLPHAMLCWAYIFHADALREWNRLDEALELALQGVRLSEQTETIVALYLGCTILMRIYLARREMDAARLAFQKAEEALAKTYSPYRRDAYLIVHWMQFWVASGEQERMRNWLREIEQPGSGDTAVHAPLANEREEVARARMLLAEQRPAEALSLLEPLLGKAEQQERWSHVIEIKILQALTQALHHEDQEALTVLAQAVYLAEPEGYIRAFVDEGAEMATLLSRLRDQEKKQGPTPYLDTLLAAFSHRSTTHAPLTPGSGEPRGYIREQPLSERELEVLQLIAHGDSNQEIADRLVITLDTVKRHVTHIFEKLGVHNRVQAVARARTLGLLSNEP